MFFAENFLKVTGFQDFLFGQDPIIYYDYIRRCLSKEQDIVRSLVELKLQVEELRRRMDAQPREVAGSALSLGSSRPEGAVVVAPVVRAIEPAVAPGPRALVTITPGMTMADIERAAIESALRETRGNRRKAAEMLAIGERTMYRKLKEYQLDGVADES